MIKNDLKDNIVDEFLLTLEEIKRDENNEESTLALIKESYKKHLGFNYSLLSSLGFYDLAKMLNHNRIDDYTKVTLLGILVVKEAEILETSHNQDFFNKYLRAFSILSPVALEEKETKFPEFKDSLSNVIDKLLQYHLPLDTSKEIFKTLESLGDFSRAEDLAFEILEDDDTFKDTLKDFYNRLLEFDDETLLKGNLSRTEILESINDL